MAIKSVRTTREITYDFGVVYEGVIFEKVTNIGNDGSATVVVLGAATLVLPVDSYEIIQDPEQTEEVKLPEPPEPKREGR